MAENKKKSAVGRISRPCRTVKDVTNDANIGRDNSRSSVRFVRDAFGQVDSVQAEIRVPHDQKDKIKNTRKVYAPLPEKKVTSYSSKSSPLSNPDLNSVHRVGLDIVGARKALENVDNTQSDPEKRLDFAKKKIKESPEEREKVEKEAALAVDFDGDEVIFKDLQALDLTSEIISSDVPSKRMIIKRKQQARPRSPTIEDFHIPFAGEDRPSEPSDHDSQAIFRMLEQTQNERRRERRDESHEDYFRRLQEWGML